MITKAFWALAALDAIAAVVLWKFFLRGTHGYAVAMFLVVVAAAVVPILVFPLLRSDGWRSGAFFVLLGPSALLLFSVAAASLREMRDERQFSGSAYFHGPALELAQAMIRHDNERMKQLIPAAGDLNEARGGGTTLWQFGVLQADEREESIEMLRTLIAAGADPKRDTSSDSLEHAAAVGPRLTRFLLEAGSNPNLTGSEGRPLWWRTMKPGEDDSEIELLLLMLDHGADVRLRAPEGRGPIGQALASGYWYIACLLVERGADWKEEPLQGGTFPVLLDWEILRREESEFAVPEKLRKVLAELTGKPMVGAAARPRGDGEVRIPDLLREASVEKLEKTRAAVARLAQRPDWVRRVTAFHEDSDFTQRRKVALVLSLKPEDLPEEAQERCWMELREQVAWYDRNAASSPKQPNAWLLKDTAVIAMGLASIPGPVRERHRGDFAGLRERIAACRRANDPGAAGLADLAKGDWVGR